MTAPYAARAESAIRSGVDVVARGTLIRPDGSTVALPLTSARVTFDEAWTPHVQAQVEVAPSRSLAQELDGRVGVRVRLDAGYRYAGDVEDVHTLADLGVRRRTHDHRSGQQTLPVVLASDEALVQDWTPLGAALTFPAGTPVVVVVRDLLHWRVLPDAVILNTLPPSAVTATDLVVGTGVDVWATLADVVDAVEGWLWVDGARIWHLSPRPQSSGVSAHIIRGGATGTLTDLEDVVDRETWANAVLLTYPTGDQAWAWIEDGPLSVTAAPVRVERINRGAAWPGADAAKRVARSLVRRYVTRGRGQTIGAVAALWLRPGMTVSVTAPGEEPTRQLVSRVTFDLPAGTMTVRTRHPEIDPTIGIGA